MYVGRTPLTLQDIRAWNTLQEQGCMVRAAAQQCCCGFIVGGHSCCCSGCACWAGWPYAPPCRQAVARGPYHPLVVEQHSSWVGPLRREHGINPPPLHEPLLAPPLTQAALPAVPCLPPGL